MSLALLTPALDVEALELEFFRFLIWMLSDEESDAEKIERETELMWSLREYNSLAETPHARRQNPKTHSMRREGRRYAIRKDHGTTASRKEIEAINAQRNDRTENSVRAERRRRKMSQHGGNPRYARTAR